MAVLINGLLEGLAGCCVNQWVVGRDGCVNQWIVGWLC